MNSIPNISSKLMMSTLGTSDITAVPKDARQLLDRVSQAAAETGKYRQKRIRLEMMHGQARPEDKLRFQEQLAALDEDYMDHGWVTDGAVALWQLSRHPSAQQKPKNTLGFKLSPELRQKILDEGMPFKRGGLAQVRKYMAGGSVNFGPLTTPYS
jgi:hypothetical protein